MPDIFLSYNREDRARAKLFAEAFEAQGFKVWWDGGLRTGEAYDQVTEKALREAKAVVVLWSKRSVDSRWVRAEATLADRNKTLVPCMIEPCERPIMFELTQTAELSHWQGDAGDRAWVAFLEDVRLFLAKERAAAAMAHAVAGAAPQPKGEQGDVPSLAVMPFANRSGGAEDDALAYGMVEDVIAAVSCSPEIRVLASSSTLAWTGKAMDVRAVGRELGVRYVMEGNVRRMGENLRVTVQLVEAETAAILWNQKFDRPLSELADLQEELVVEVAGRLGTQLSRIEMERALRKPGDMTAYEAAMRSMAVHSKLSMDRLPFAVAEARRAVSLAPDYALARAVLAISLASQFYWSGATDATLKAEAGRQVAQAVALGPDDSIVLSYAAVSLTFIDQPREALRHAQRTIDLNPNFYGGHLGKGNACLRLGRNDEAIAALEASERIAPGMAIGYGIAARKSHAHFVMGRMEQAVEQMERSFRLNPDYPLTLVLRAGLCELIGRREDAAECVQRLRAMEPGTSAEFHVVRYVSRVEPKQAEPLMAAFRKAWDESTAN